MLMPNWQESLIFSVTQSITGDTFLDIPKFEDVKNPDYKAIYTTGVFGGLSPDDARIVFFIDRIQAETINEPPERVGEQRVSKITREALIEVHMAPTQFKRIALWMQKNIQTYEEVFGAIPLEPKKSTINLEPKKDV